MSEVLSIAKSSNTMQELLDKKQISKQQLADYLCIRTLKTVHVKLNNVSGFNIPEVIAMSKMFDVPFVDLCDLIKREIDSKKQ